MADLTGPERNALAMIAALDDPDRLRRFIANARSKGSRAVEAAAFERLCHVQPEATPGTVQHDVWQSIHALEELLRDERGKTVRLSRTRQKIARDGEAKTVSDLTLKPTPSQWFHDLLDRDLPGLAFEAVVLRHPRTFDAQAQRAAAKRFEAAGVDPNQFKPEPQEIPHG